MSENKIRYSDAELEEFRSIIDRKLEKARIDYEQLKAKYDKPIVYRELLKNDIIVSRVKNDIINFETTIGKNLANLDLTQDENKTITRAFKDKLNEMMVLLSEMAYKLSKE